MPVTVRRPSSRCRSDTFPGIPPPDLDADNAPLEADRPRPSPGSSRDGRVRVGTVILARRVVGQACVWLHEFPRAAEGEQGMRRVVAVANAKGGVGKTSITAGLAGLAARSGRRVLTIDADPQGNLSHDLGYATGDGQSLASAIANGTPLEPLRDVRPNLDCVAGGSALFDIPATYVARMARGQTMTGLRATLEQVRPEKAHADYDLILVDTPPGEPVLQELVFHSSDFLIIPTRSDEASLDGLVTVAHRFAAARRGNPNLRLLGVLLFGARHGSNRLRDMVRASLQESLEGVAPVFDTAIRYHESAAVDMRRHGLLPYELERRHKTDKAVRLARLRVGLRGTGDTLLSRDAVGLAEDYAALAEEVFAAIIEFEKNGPSDDEVETGYAAPSAAAPAAVAPRFLGWTHGQSHRRRPRPPHRRTARHAPSPLVLPTVWDVWSAKTAVAAGFQALTIGSHPLADSRGAEDHEGQTFDEVVAAVRPIIAAVDVPVSVDLEAGYGQSPEDLDRRARRRRRRRSEHRGHRAFRGRAGAQHRGARGVHRGPPRRRRRRRRAGVGQRPHRPVPARRRRGRGGGRGDRAAAGARRGRREQRVPGAHPGQRRPDPARRRGRARAGELHGAPGAARPRPVPRPRRRPDHLRPAAAVRAHRRDDRDDQELAAE